MKTAPRRVIPRLREMILSVRNFGRNIDKEIYRGNVKREKEEGESEAQSRRNTRLIEKCTSTGWRG